MQNLSVKKVTSTGCLSPGSCITGCCTLRSCWFFREVWSRCAACWRWVSLPLTWHSQTLPTTKTKSDTTKLIDIGNIQNISNINQEFLPEWVMPMLAADTRLCWRMFCESSYWSRIDAIANVLKQVIYSNYRVNENTDPGFALHDVETLPATPTHKTR